MQVWRQDPFSARASYDVPLPFGDAAGEVLLDLPSRLHALEEFGGLRLHLQDADDVAASRRTQKGSGASVHRRLHRWLHRLRRARQDQ